MATLIRETEIAVSAEIAWAAVRDIGAVHHRLVPGLVKDVKLEPGVRHVTFSNGLVLEEMIVGVDERSRRLAYAAVNRAKHHQASMQVVALGENRCRFVWITDVLPDEVSARFAAVMDQALPIIERTLLAQSRMPS